MLNEEHDPTACKRELSTLLGLDEAEINAEQREIAVDHFFYAFAFSKERCFDAAKTSALLAILKTVLDKDIYSCEPTSTMQTSFALFKKLLLTHSVERPPHAVGVFSPEDVEAVTDFVLNAYFRHWRLYKLVFTNKLQVTLEQTTPNGIIAPTAPRPLAEALTQQVQYGVPSPVEPPVEPEKEDAAAEAKAT